MKKHRFRRFLLWTFLAGVTSVTGFSYYYMKLVIPDRINIVQNQEEIVQFSLPFHATLLSESEEVVLGNKSDIPKGQITITQNRQ